MDLQQLVMSRGHARVIPFSFVRLGIERRAFAWRHPQDLAKSLVCQGWSETFHPLASGSQSPEIAGVTMPGWALDEVAKVRSRFSNGVSLFLFLFSPHF